MVGATPITRQVIAQFPQDLLQALEILKYFLKYIPSCDRIEFLPE